MLILCVESTSEASSAQAVPCQTTCYESAFAPAWELNSFLRTRMECSCPGCSIVWVFSSKHHIKKFENRKLELVFQEVLVAAEDQLWTSYGLVLLESWCT